MDDASGGGRIGAEAPSPVIIIVVVVAINRVLVPRGV